MKYTENKTCTREHEIIETAREVFSEYGYKKTTMDDVSARMNITRSALYYYYKKKDDLFHAIMERLMAEYKEQMEKAISEKSTTLERFEIFCEYYISYRKKFYNMFKCNDDDYPMNFSLYIRIKEMSVELHRKIITGILKNDKKFRNSADMDYYAYLLTQSIRGIVQNSFIDDINKLQHDVSEMCRIFCQGLGMTSCACRK